MTREAQKNGVRQDTQSDGGGQIFWANNGEFICPVSLGEDPGSRVLDQLWAYLAGLMQRWASSPLKCFADVCGFKADRLR